MRSEVWHQVHRLHGEGLGVEAIARATGRAPYRVRRLLMESGALRRQYEHGVRDGRVLEAYRDGVTHREICVRFNIPASVLLNILRSHGEPPRPRRQPVDPAVAQAVVADYLDSEMTRDEICSAHGVTSAILDRILEEEEIPRRTPPTTGRRKNGWDWS